MTTLLTTTLSCSRASPARCPEPSPAAAAPPAKAGESSPPAVGGTAASVAADVVARINAGDFGGLFARFAPEMQRALPLADLTAFSCRILATRGRLLGVTPIQANEHQGTFRLAAERGAWRLQIVVDDAGRIAGLVVGELEEPPPVARSAPMGLPFRGEWLVVWGGDLPELNYHVDSPSQRRAADLVVVDATGSTHKGDGHTLTDYYAYGQDILAMADGVVVTVVDGVPDSVPGELDPTFLPGNMVVLRHEGYVYSVYAHLIPGSTKAKVGSRVRRGQVLGACGNSGNSSEPHLHVQLQDGPRFGKSWGIEVVFAEAVVVRDGASELRTDYSPRKGDRISPRVGTRSLARDAALDRSLAPR